ncbi:MULTISPECIES: universal stress protein [Nocardia]|uniref:universal stress protein n=1 Tax=Nocardia TaxID=1817 RepID=UPI000D699D6E|nr:MULTISPECIES: universal stress protein [Nocardia]
MTTPANHQSIVVGINRSRASLAAARWAAAIAAHRQVPLELLAVVSTPDHRLTAATRAEADLLPRLREAAKEKVAEVADVVREDFPRSRVVEQVVEGFPPRELIAAGESAQLLVVAAGTDDRLSTVLLGSTALRVANKAGCPVAVWRGNRAHPLPDERPILVGVDGSPDGDAAIGHAFEMAALLGVAIVALHVWNDPDLLQWTPVADSWDVLAQQEEELLGERLSGWADRYPDVEVTRILQKGPTAETLLEHAADAQLVVTGSHGHNRVTGLFVGSTSQNLLHHAPCPTLICRDNG